MDDTEARRLTDELLHEFSKHLSVSHETIANRFEKLTALVGTDLGPVRAQHLKDPHIRLLIARFIGLNRWMISTEKPALHNILELSRSLNQLFIKLPSWLPITDSKSRETIIKESNKIEIRRRLRHI